MSLLAVALPAYVASTFTACLARHSGFGRFPSQSESHLAGTLSIPFFFGWRLVQSTLGGEKTLRTWQSAPPPSSRETVSDGKLGRRSKQRPHSWTSALLLHVLRNIGHVTYIRLLGNLANYT